MVRWYQTGAFQPFFRGHAHLDSKRREPWLKGEPFTTHIRNAIKTRYTLLPLWYTLFHETSLNGSPIIRFDFFPSLFSDQKCSLLFLFVVCLCVRLFVCLFVCY